MFLKGGNIMKGRLKLLLTPIIFTGMLFFSLKCDLDKSKLAPKDTNGFTAEDMDKGQNNLWWIYPRIIDMEIEPTGSGTQPPWLFYVRFDRAMDTSTIPTIKLEEITNNNQTSGVNAIDTASLKWSEGKNNELQFKTGSSFKVICTPPATYCDNYLLTISGAKSVLGIEMDGNGSMGGGFLDDYIDAPSAFELTLMDIWWNNVVWFWYPSFTLPATFNWNYAYDLWLAGVGSNDAGDYLDPSLTDANENGYIHISFSDYMNKSDISNSTIEIRGPDGSTINGNWWVDTDGNGSPDKEISQAPATSLGNTNTYYDMFWFRPQQLPLGLGRYTGIVHCNSIHKFELTDATNSVFQKPYLCNDFDYDGNNNDWEFEFYVTSDGNAPNLANRVWGVYTTNDTGPFGANEIKTNQAFVLFQTPDPKNNLMDTSTLIPQNLSILMGGVPVSVTTSVEERYFRCAKSTVWIINAPTNVNLNNSDLTISYKVKDKAGNTLDGNGDFLYQLDPSDNFHDPSLPYDGISNNNPPANYVQVASVYTQNNPHAGYTLNPNQILIVFDTPSEGDDLMNIGSLSADDLQLSGAGTGSCTCTCPGGSCVGDVTLNPVDDTTNFSVPTTTWQVTFNNPGGCVIKDCTLTVRGGTLTGQGGRPADICGNWLYPDYVLNSVP